MVLFGSCADEGRHLIAKIFSYEFLKQVQDNVAPTGLEPATTRLTVEVTLIYDTV